MVDLAGVDQVIALVPAEIDAGEDFGDAPDQRKVPLNTPDFSSFLLRAKNSGATTIALALAGADLTNAIKQANEFRVADGGQNLAAMLSFISDVNAMGLSVAQGIVTSESFYWDLNDQTRQWSRRFMEKLPGQVPNMVHAGAYSAVLHYLRSVASAGTIDASVVVARMKTDAGERFQ